MNGGDDPSDLLSDLTEAYCDGVVSDEDFHQLEAILLASAEARRAFVRAVHGHAELHFAVRARRSADAALEKVLADLPATPPDNRTRPWPRWNTWALACGAVASLMLMGVVTALVVRTTRTAPTPARSAAERRDGNVAWLVNAQDCEWAASERDMPGRDMRAGKLLRLRRGLAEIEFDRGARVILQGPAELVLVNGAEARLIQGALTARVPGPARGFTILSPGGKVVDHGTEFGLSVDDQGATTVRVFHGIVEAFPLFPGPEFKTSVTVLQDQTLRLGGRNGNLEKGKAEGTPVQFVRTIKPPPLITPKTLRLDFSQPVPGSIQDASGRGTGLTSRLPGTGAAIAALDPNLVLDPEARILHLTTTRSDLNTQDRMPFGEYLGFRLTDLGLSGHDDFEISTTIPKIPSLNVVGQFGLYVGANSASSIRGGLLSQSQPDRYGLFLVNNHLGIDSEPNEVGLMTTGDNLRLTLRRIDGRFSLVVDNLTRGSSNTLTVNHPSFLDQEPDLYAGLFGANTQSDVSKTLTVKELKVTLWTRETGERAAASSRPPR